MKPAYALLCALAVNPALAAESHLHLKVVGVHDGDTITGLTEDKQQLKIRLDAIDGPELGYASRRCSSQLHSFAYL